VAKEELWLHTFDVTSQMSNPGFAYDPDGNLTSNFTNARYL